MKLDHVAIWAVNIEVMRVFYEKYFDARPNPKYENERKRVWRWALKRPSMSLQNDFRATASRFSMGQGGRATDTTRA